MAHQTVRNLSRQGRHGPSDSAEMDRNRAVIERARIEEGLHPGKAIMLALESQGCPPPANSRRWPGAPPHIPASGESEATMPSNSGRPYCPAPGSPIPIRSVHRKTPADPRPHARRSSGCGERQRARWWRPASSSSRPTPPGQRAVHRGPRRGRSGRIAQGLGPAGVCRDLREAHSLIHCRPDLHPAPTAPPLPPITSAAEICGGRRAETHPPELRQAPAEGDRRGRSQG